MEVEESDGGREERWKKEEEKWRERVGGCRREGRKKIQVREKERRRRKGKRRGKIGLCDSKKGRKRRKRKMMEGKIRD